MTMKQWSVKITVAGTTYQDDDLIGAEKIKFILVNKQIFTLKNNDFTFTITTGTITITLLINDSLVFMYKK